MNFRVLIFAIATISAIVLSIPSLLQTNSGKKISLGLDLQGGMYMLLGIKTEEAIAKKIKSIASAIKYSTTKKMILIDGLSIKETSFNFILLDDDEIKNLDDILLEYKGIKVVKTNNLTYTISLLPSEAKITQEQAISQAIETIRNRLNQTGLAETSVSKQGEDKIAVEVPGIKTLEQEQRTRKLISQTANLELMSVDEQRADQVYTITDKKLNTVGDIVLPSSSNKNKKYLLRQVPILTGEQITDAQVVFDESNQPVISFKLNAFGAKVFGNFTANNIGNRLAVVLDGAVYSDPVIRERIGGGSGQISGNFTIQEAGDLAIALRSGALPASVYVLEKRSVGPSLGADSIKSSLIALISGFMAVILFMILYYSRSGLISNIALLTNIFIIIAVMALLGATLTLPGMAGIVLTIGIAVDANVIINERIRELLKSGKSIRYSVEEGYNKAITAIMDANITTLLVAFILYAYGTGPIKGFAITISIGILASMLTAILGTHGIFQMLMPRMSKNNDKGNSKNKEENLRKWFGIK